MRIAASGVGKTFDDAMVKVVEDLKTIALHSYELVPTEIGGVKVIDPQNSVAPNENAAELEATVRKIEKYLPATPDGHLCRVVLVLNDDGALSAAKVEIDFIRA